ncbi:hypothetical protein LWI29_027783 [Acer saccharum]|uniref:Apple domain-containing protein n=1 Tax=Acer saccharum TaxID=4024 RepID=A0AA39SP32_ACESA|nr:hypothetical protein LWI29_027783 [Acer saccharum]
MGISTTQIHGVLTTTTLATLQMNKKRTSVILQMKILLPVLTIDPNGSLIYDGGDMSYGVCPIFEDKMTMICRKGVLDFNLKYGLMSGDGFKFKESDNMTSIDFELKFQNNCSCFAYATTNREKDTGCEIWSTKFIEAHKGNYRQIYMEVEPKRKSTLLL